MRTKMTTLAVLLGVVAMGCSKEHRWQHQDHQPFYGSLGETHFHLELPEGTTVDAVTSQNVRYRYDDGRGVPLQVEVGFSMPHRQMAEMIQFEQRKVLAGKALPPSLPLATRNVAANDDEPAGHWAFASRDHADETGHRVIVYAEHAVSDGALRCTASVYPRDGDNQVELAEAAMMLCFSLEPSPAGEAR